LKTGHVVGLLICSLVLIVLKQWNDLYCANKLLGYISCTRFTEKISC